MPRKYCESCHNTRMANEVEPCEDCEGYSFQIVITDELFEVTDNPNYVENTEQKF